jgi:hypothetical protein
MKNPALSHSGGIVGKLRLQVPCEGRAPYLRWQTKIGRASGRDADVGRVRCFSAFPDPKLSAGRG